MNRAKLDIILDKLRADSFYEQFLSVLKMFANGGIKFEKTVGAAAGGNCGQIFVPRRYIGQVCEVVLVPRNGEVIALEEGIRELGKKLRKERKKLSMVKKGVSEPETEEPYEELKEENEETEDEETY